MYPEGMLEDVTVVDVVTQMLGYGGRVLPVNLQARLDRVQELLSNAGGRLRSKQIIACIIADWEAEREGIRTSVRSNCLSSDMRCTLNAIGKITMPEEEKNDE